MPLRNPQFHSFLGLRAGRSEDLLSGADSVKEERLRGRKVRWHPLSFSFRSTLQRIFPPSLPYLSLSITLRVIREGIYPHLGALRVRGAKRSFQGHSPTVRIEAKTHMYLSNSKFNQCLPPRISASPGYFVNDASCWRCLGGRERALGQE